MHQLDGRMWRWEPEALPSRLALACRREREITSVAATSRLTRCDVIISRLQRHAARAELPAISHRTGSTQPHRGARYTMSSSDSKSSPYNAIDLRALPFPDCYIVSSQKNMWPAHRGVVVVKSKVFAQMIEELNEASSAKVRVCTLTTLTACDEIFSCGDAVLLL